MSHALEGLPITDPNRSYREILGVIPAGQSRSFTVDCSKDVFTAIWLGDNDSAGVFDEFSDVFVECYLLDVTLS